ncbi:response regulator transcription factor [Okeania sp.]|uniref:response regulator transcription factor n=1 Tax=Okeania sp. TaxID=3100323 RepID=UPI002B4AC34E|nr:response regulator transcription factor [Okeania sp.]MEB3340870.1 response regulator transcription factor [Okeania sp.]
MSSAKILAIDDDPAIRTLIQRYLSQQNYQVESAGDGKTALELFSKFAPDLVVLDVNLPDTTGFKLCQEMQKNTNVFVLMLTSLADEESKLQGFEGGADDYMTKPFGLIELSARVRAILKRRKLVLTPEPKNLKIGDLVIFPLGREVKVKEESIALTALEFDLLNCLATEPGRVWKRSELIQEVWNFEYVGDERVVDVHISQIRKKIEKKSDNLPRIITVRGIGYKLDLLSSNQQSKE